MKKYDIFSSEGGYRVCLGVYNDEPTIDNSPWFQTLSEAETFSIDSRFDDESKDYGVFRDGYSWVASFPDNEFYSFDTRQEAIESVVIAISKLGYSREYILRRRKDLHQNKQSKQI